MKSISVVSLLLILIGVCSEATPAEGIVVSPGFALENGDANGDWKRDISDPIHLLSHLFFGGSAPAPLASCGSSEAAVQNGDSNGDGILDVSDGIHLLNWLYINGAEPAPVCHFAAGSAGGRNNNPRVIPPQARAYGKSLGDWGAAWWQWALPIPAAENPVADETGEFCDVDQSGPVWFLAGNFGGATERTCTVPAGKALFFPMLNWVLWDPEDLAFLVDAGVEGDTPEEILRTGASTLTDATTDLSCTVDGVELQDLFNYRGASSGAFAIDLGDIFLPDYEPGIRDPAVTEGYWLMLAPLPPGEHTVVFASELSCTGDNCFGLVFDFGVEVTYHLTVE